MRIDRLAYNPENAKVGQKGHGLLNVTYFYNVYPYKICLTSELANFKFGAYGRLTTRSTIQMAQNVGQVDAWSLV